MKKQETPWLAKGEKLICFGDSLTAAKDGYITIVEDKLRSLQIEVVNAGVGGDKTPNALVRLKSDVIALKPDAVSIFLEPTMPPLGVGSGRMSPASNQAHIKAI